MDAALLFGRIFNAMGPDDTHALKALGIPGDLFTTFAVAAHRRGCVYLACRREEDAEFESWRPASAVRVGDVVDIVKFRMDSPDIWQQAFNEVDVLGCCTFRAANVPGHRVRLWRTPLEWARHGGVGLCLLTGDSVDRRITLRTFKALICEDAAHAAAVWDELTIYPGCVPQLLVRP